MPYKSPEALKAYQQKWRKDNPDYQKKWLQENPTYYKEWIANNPHYRRVINYIRRCPGAKPPWVKIQDFKEVVMNCPKGYILDHIVPLNGRYIKGNETILISGLNVPWNLQPKTHAENMRKGNYMSQEDFDLACSLKK